MTATRVDFLCFITVCTITDDWTSETSLFKVMDEMMRCKEFKGSMLNSANRRIALETARQLPSKAGPFLRSPSQKSHPRESGIRSFGLLERHRFHGFQVPGVALASHPFKTV